MNNDWPYLYFYPVSSGTFYLNLAGKTMLLTMLTSCVLA